MAISLRFAQDLYDELHQHLFPGDGDEHGAVIAASVLQTSRGTRLLAHRLFLAKDGVDYVPGQHGYRALTAGFVMDCVLECADMKMAYLAVHCHGGTDRVDFSPTDMQSHDRGYPALRDIVDGPPVGGLVFAKQAIAGDIWFADGSRDSLELAVVAGHPITTLHDKPQARPAGAPVEYDRQARLFGDRGQALLAKQKVGIIGAGGASSLIVEQLSRLGVGELVIIDPDSIEASNLSRVVGSLRRDVRPWLTSPRLGPLAALGERLRSSKVRIARRLSNQAPKPPKVTALRQDVTEASAAEYLLDCDYLFLAADSMQARLVFNALVHQYVIPGAQMGVKAQISKQDGSIVDLFAAYRPVLPGAGCLWCNGLIPPDQLQAEATDREQLKQQRYVDDAEIPAPSVITLNGIAASLATNGYLMSVTGLLGANSGLTWVKHYPQTGEFIEESPRKGANCQECSTAGRLGRGPMQRLPLRV